MSKLADALFQPPTIITFVFLMLMGLVYILLPFNFAIPIYIPVILLLMVIMIGLIYFIHIYTDVQFNPEGADFIYSRKTGTPIMMIEAHNGAGKWVRGIKQKAGDIFFAFNRQANEGIHIDPAVQSGSVPLTTMKKGLNIYHYGTGSPFPMGSKQAIAQDEILNHVRKNYPMLNVFDGTTILEHLARNRSELPHDCKTLATRADIDVEIPVAELKKFRDKIESEVFDKLVAGGVNTENMTNEELAEQVQIVYDEKVKGFIIEYRANQLVKIFMNIQDETAKLALPQGKLFSYAEAFIHSTSAFTAFDYQTLMQLFEMIAKKENDIDLKWIVGILIGVGMFLILLFVAMSIGKSAGVVG